MNRPTFRKPNRRGVAAAIGAAGVLALSSGIAVLAAAPAHAATISVNICHATSSDTNPYVFITVDDDSANFAQQLSAHMAHREDPNKRWKSDGTFGGVPHSDGDPKPDLIGDYVGPDGPVVLDGEIDSETCDGAVTELETTASASFVDPDCDNENQASYSTEGDNVTFELDGTVGAGETVTVTATVDDGYVFAGDQQSLEFEHTFGAVEPDCDVIEPPTDDPDPEPEPEVTPTVVSAGVVPTASPELRSGQGMALIGGGLVLLVVAGGVARPRRVRS